MGLLLKLDYPFQALEGSSKGRLLISAFQLANDHLQICPLPKDPFLY